MFKLQLTDSIDYPKYINHNRRLHHRDRLTTAGGNNCRFCLHRAALLIVNIAHRALLMCSCEQCSSWQGSTEFVNQDA